MLAEFEGKMRKHSKLILAICLIAFALTQEKVCSHLGFGQLKFHGASTENTAPIGDIDHVKPSSFTTTDEVYRWDEQRLNWVLADEQNTLSHLVSYTSPNHAIAEPIKLNWKILMDIQYKSKFFPEMDAEMYAPVYPEAVTALDKQEVLIEGYVIPLDEKGKVLALSYNPYSACFFCGKASPASVISLYLHKSKNQYSVDDFVTFKGVFHLNHDDPNEFYYILRDAREIDAD